MLWPPSLWRVSGIVVLLVFEFCFVSLSKPENVKHYCSLNSTYPILFFATYWLKSVYKTYNLPSYGEAPRSLYNSKLSGSKTWQIMFLLIKVKTRKWNLRSVYERIINIKSDKGKSNVIRSSKMPVLGVLILMTDFVGPERYS